MRPKINTIMIQTHVHPGISTPFLSVSFHRGNRQTSSTFKPTPSTLMRIMRWQAATLLAEKSARTEAK